MADPLISIYVADASVRERLKKIQRRTGDLRPALRNVGEMLLLSTDERFEKEIDPSGEPWQANTPFTISQKRALGRIEKILQSTGRGRSSIAYQVTRDTLTIGTNVSYMRKHQLGINVPKREFLGLSKEDNEELMVILEEFVTEE